MATRTELGEMRQQLANIRVKLDEVIRNENQNNKILERMLEALLKIPGASGSGSGASGPSASASGSGSSSVGHQVTELE